MPDEKAYYNLESKQSKLEDAMTKLTEVSADLNKIIAVHELRLTQQEKITDSLELILEKRRDEYDVREGKIYDHIDTSYDKLSKKITDLEKMMWVYGGGFALAAFVIANWGDVAKLLLKN